MRNPYLVKPQTALAEKIVFWLLMASVALACFFIIIVASSYNQSEVSSRYARPFEERQALYKQRMAQKQAESPNKPIRSHGMREAEIQKREGNHYSTY